MHCGRCYEDSMTESLWCDPSKEMRADVSTSPEFSLSRRRRDTRRKDSHIATFQPSRENQALPRISWITSRPELRRFLHPPLQEPALPYRAPVFHPCVDTVTRRDALTRMPMLLQNTKGRIQTPKMITFFYFCYFMCFFKDYRFSGRHVLLAEMQSFSDAEVARVI